MAIVAPFRALTYNIDARGDLSELIAPPYDVISEEEQEVYYQAHPNNVIRLILGKKKIGDSDWDNRYTRSADCFKRWESEDVLVRSDFVGMYVTSLKYDPGDGSGGKVRWGLIALVRVEDEDSPVILPHEKTFSAHRDDRLRLMRACNAQLSQIFGLFEDPVNRILGHLKEAVDTSPLAAFDFRDGTSHKMWAVRDTAIFKNVAEAMNDKPIFIADGHHRYETARNFRNMMRARYGRRPANRSYEFALMYLSNMDDQGLTILPSHRLIKRCAGFEIGQFLDRAGRWFEIREVPLSESQGTGSIEHLKGLIEEEGRGNSVVGFHHQGGGSSYLLSLKPGARDEMGDDLHASLKELDVLVLSRLILQGSLGFRKEDLDNEKNFHYDSDMRQAVSKVDSGTYQMAFLLNHTKIDQVKEIASNALIMPRKSTYFYPKVLSGTVFNKIDPHEIIQVP